MAWTYTFGDHDGYDCMTAGFTIYDESGNELLVIDVKEFAFAEPRPKGPMNGLWSRIMTV